MARGTTVSVEPKHIARHVGQRLRTRRIMLGLSQGRLSKLVGVSYQQIHKYEQGTNSLSATRIYQLAAVLGVPISFFFQDLDTPSTDTTIALGESAPEAGASERELLEAASAFQRITDARMRQIILLLLRTTAEGDNTGQDNRQADISALDTGSKPAAE